MSVSRRELLAYLEEHGWSFSREGANHTLVTNGQKKIPIARHKVFDRITANQICKQAGLKPPF